MKRRRILAAILTLILICSCVMTGCGSKSDLEEITVTYVTSPLNVPTIVEKNHSIFAENMKEIGIETVNYSEITSGADQTQALASGDIQFLYAVGATSVILSAANDADIKIISMYSRSPEAFCLFSNDETITSPEDLRGKTIAGPQGTILHELLVAYLATADMTLADVNFMNTTIPDAMAALSGGSVDCALLAGAAAYNTQAGGAHLVTNGKDLVEATIVCATTQKFYDEHKDAVDKFLEAQEEVLTYMEENEDAVLQEAAENLDLDVDAVRDMYAYYDFDMTIRDSDIEAMDATMQFMLNAEMIEKEVDIESLVIR
ncbi:MAG: ABC transporter substrate-binding protein [Lachnospiraceae bacterium]|jgi:sulfonate transport system substrate-binding protein